MSQLKSIVERIERLNSEEDAIKSDKRDVYAEAKAIGYDPKILRKVISLRAKETNEVQEENALLETYLNELGQADLAPVGMAVATHPRIPREASTVHEAGPPAASPEDGAANQADHAAEPATGVTVQSSVNDRKSSPAQTGEADTANAGTEAPPVSVSPGREPYIPTIVIPPAPTNADLAIPAFLKRAPAGPSNTEAV